jgi:hypothetical protein
MLAVGTTSLTCPIAIFFHSSFLLLRRSKEMIIAWVLALAMYIAAMMFIGDSATGAITAIAVGASSAIFVFVLSLLLKFDRTIFPADKSLPH